MLSSVAFKLKNHSWQNVCSNKSMSSVAFIWKRSQLTECLFHQHFVKCCFYTITITVDRRQHFVKCCFYTTGRASAVWGSRSAAKGWFTNPSGTSAPSNQQWYYRLGRWSGRVGAVNKHTSNERDSSENDARARFSQLRLDCHLSKYVYTKWSVTSAMQ